MEEDNRISFSLSKKLFIVFLLVLIPILAVFYAANKSNQKHLEKYILGEMRGVADNREGYVLLYLEILKNKVEEYMEEKFISRELENILEGRSNPARLNDYLNNKLGLERDFYRITVYSLKGIVVSSSIRVNIGLDRSGEEFFRNGKEGIYISERVSGFTGEPELAVSAPLFDSEGKEIGVIAAFMRLEDLGRVLSGAISRELGALTYEGLRGRRTFEIYLVNRDKLMITPSIFRKGVIYEQVVDTLPVNQCLENNLETTAFYKDYRGFEVAGASMCLPERQWTLIVENDKSELLAPLASTRFYSFVTLIVTIALIGLLVLYFVRAVIAQLIRLSSGAMEIASGNYDVSLPVRTRDEIGALSESFNKMTGDIKQRTSALRESESRLENAQRIAHIGNWEWDILKDDIFWSKEVYSIHAVPADTKISYGNFIKTIHPDDKERVIKAVREALEKGKVYSLDYRAVGALRGEGIIHAQGEVIRDENGKPVKMVGTCQDITELRRAEEALRRSEEGLSYAQKIAHIGNWEWDLVKKGAFWSDEIYRILGEEPKSFKPDFKTFFDYIHPDDRESIQALHYSSISKGQGYSVDFRVIAADGKLKFINRQAEVILGINGKPIRVFGIMQDITERKQAEEALKASERKYRTLVDNAPVSVCLSTVKGEFVFINKAGATTFGFESPEEAMREGIFARFKNPKDRDLMVEKLLEKGKVEDFEFEAVTKTGMVKNILISEVLDGELITGVAIDITDRKKAEQALVESEKKYRRLVENSLVGVYRSNLKGDLLYANDALAKLFEFETAEEMMKEGAISRYRKKEDRELLIERLKKEGRIDITELEVFTKKGDIKNIIVTAVLEDHDTLSGIVLDITRRKKAEQEIRRLNEELEKRVEERTSQLALANRELADANKEMQAFSYSVAHDLRSPLRVINGFSRILFEDYAKNLDVKGQDYLNRVLTASERMSMLIDDILKLSQVSRAEMSRETVSLGEMALSITTELKKAEPERKAQFKIEKGLIAVGDPMLLRAVLENLIGNSWKFTKNKEVTIIEFGRQGAEDGKTIFFVRDNGAGFDPRYSEKLFAPFQRLHSADEFPGTGIGLATVQRIIQRHGGRVWAEGELGKGATFYFTL